MRRWKPQLFTTHFSLLTLHPFLSLATTPVSSYDHPPWTACVVTRMLEKGRLAQLVERLVYTENVGSSSLSSPTSLRTYVLRLGEPCEPGRRTLGEGCYAVAHCAKVDGSKKNEVSARNCGGVAQLVRAPACHAGGRGFESRHSRQFLFRH